MTKKKRKIIKQEVKPLTRDEVEATYDFFKEERRKFKLIGFKISNDNR